MNAQLIFLIFVFVYAIISTVIFRYFLSLRFKGDKSLFIVISFIIFSIIVTFNTLAMFDYFSSIQSEEPTNIFQ